MTSKAQIIETNKKPFKKVAIDPITLDDIERDGRHRVPHRDVVGHS